MSIFRAFRAIRRNLQYGALAAVVLSASGTAMAGSPYAEVLIRNIAADTTKQVIKPGIANNTRKYVVNRLRKPSREDAYERARQQQALERIKIVREKHIQAYGR